MTELERRLAGRPVIASVSGGKDSAAMSLYLTELGIEHTRTFMNTGWEAEVTYEYIRGELSRVLGPIVELRADLLMPDLIRHKGMFPSRVRRFCTEELKIAPMSRYVAALDDEPVNAVGIRRAESQARARMSEWEWSDALACETWRPILNWPEDDVIAIHKRHCLKPNPLYLRGARRVGCWPCIFARKREIRLIAETDPQRIDRLRALESEVGLSARQRMRSRWAKLTLDEKVNARAAGSSPERWRPPAWFQARMGGSGACWPIDQVVSWSRTARGGRQLELFEPSASDEGCVRWDSARRRLRRHEERGATPAVFEKSSHHRRRAVAGSRRRSRDGPLAII